MARVDGDELVEPEAVYMTLSLREARNVEALLTSRGVDYAVRAEEAGRTFLLGSPRRAAVFYVSAAQAAGCLQILLECGFTRGRIPHD